MASNAQIEQRWIDAWNNLADIIRDRPDVPCQLPDWSIVSAEDCRGWLQESAYLSYYVSVQADWAGYRREAMALREMNRKPNGLISTYSEATDRLTV